ncbi:MAG: translation initiation factor IF-2, partial [Rhodospirillales bacterium]|nr:translation initiation factor IF-2 [Rhodospirillales bacterium]
ALAEGVVRERSGVGLTEEEKAQRARALQDAMRHEDSPPVLAPEADELETASVTEEQTAVEEQGIVEAAPTDETIVAEPSAEEPVVEGTAAEAPAPDVAAEAPESVQEGAQETAVHAVQAEPVAAEQQAVEAPREDAVAPSEGKAPEAKETAGKKAKPKAAEEEQAQEKEDDEPRGRTKRPVRAEVRKPLTAPRRGEPRRRTGKLTVTDALDDQDRGERGRSLASVRRAREKERLKQRLAGIGDSGKVIREVVIPEVITVQELSNRMAERSTDVIKSLMNMGVMANINQTIDADTAELLAAEFGHKAKRVSESDVEIGLKGDEDADEALQPRPPVVTVMGHVDHGKTSILDVLRKTDVVAHEAGGITQHIGAYQITVAGGAKITFIDTPGHAAFTQMRARGANVTDIVVLVVAADDGVMPQTIEAISHAKAAGVPMIVAINKMDRPDANAQRIRTELLQYDVQVEEMGGETLSIEVSAKTGLNVDTLVDSILLQSEILDLKANPHRSAEGVVVEAKMERGRGSVATVLVQRGTLRVGDIFVAGAEWGRVRGMFDAMGEALTEAGPGVPAEILGLNGTPAAGDEVAVVDSEARAREVTDFRSRKEREAKVTATGRTNLEQMFDRIREGEEKILPVVLKADVHGSSEAIIGALDNLGTEEVKVQVLHAGVGGINESDITLASASKALIVGFNVRANPQARELAKRDNVDVRYYSVIYNLVDDLKKMLSGLLAPQIRENIIGYAQIREVFNITKVGKVAGCMVTEGNIRRGTRVRLLRDNVVIHEGDLSQLKRFKDDVREVREGYDCGIALASYQDIQTGDVLECFELQKVEREL